MISGRNSPLWGYGYILGWFHARSTTNSMHLVTAGWGLHKWNRRQTPSASPSVYSIILGHFSRKECYTYFITTKNDWESYLGVIRFLHRFMSFILTLKKKNNVPCYPCNTVTFLVLGEGLQAFECLTPGEWMKCFSNRRIEICIYQ